LWYNAVFSFLASFYLGVFTMDSTAKEINNMLNSPNTQRIEGIISHFERAKEQKRYVAVETESFNVDGIRFSYTDALLGKFNSFSKIRNEVLHSGVHVRITYLMDKEKYYYRHPQILKIEIRHK
jgi:hypothetical protein